MIKNQRVNYPAMLLISLYLMVEVTLYFYFMYNDFENPRVNTSWVKYMIVILCFAATVIHTGWKRKSMTVLCVKTEGMTADVKADGMADEPKTADYMLCLAFLFTVISDWFLLIAGPYLLGMITFILAQQFHGFYIASFRSRNRNGIRLLTELVWMIIILIILKSCHMELSAMIVATIIYFISLLANIICSIRLFVEDKKQTGRLLLAIGFLLFLGCDINVGLFNLSDYIPLNFGGLQTLTQNSGYLMWAFYAPSQVCITMSAFFHMGVTRCSLTKPTNIS